jgi:hypothetical protein
MVVLVKKVSSDDRTKVSFGETRRRLIIQRAKGIVMEKSPIHIEKLLSFIEYEMGIRRENAKGVLVILHDIEKITIDKATDIVHWGKRVEIPQGDLTKDGSKT